MAANQDTDSSDSLDRAKRLAAQQLWSLRQSGVETLPQATGKYQFANLVCEPLPAATQVDAVTQAEPTPAAQPIAPAVATPVSEQASKPEPKRKAAKVETNSPTASPQPISPAGYESELLQVDPRAEQLSILSQEVSQCTRCSELVSCRNKTVFGVGDPMAELCFLGEGPGADEDRQGEPFVGRAGQLLDKILGACKMSRKQVYILNTVKCRPPGNRNPNELELENCWPYAVRQLELIQPKFICCLGSVAAKTLLNTTQSIGRMRGQFFQYRGSQVVVTYHPAYLLRNPSAKRQVWDDMKMLMAAMGREV